LAQIRLAQLRYASTQDRDEPTDTDTEASEKNTVLEQCCDFSHHHH
jgi:hypothetical protein